MVGNFARATCGLIAALVWLSAGSLAAQEAVLTELYGRGVHQYFAGNCTQAVSDLTAAIDGGTKDPRAFYFRALAEMRVGQQDMATLDLQMGASLETADVNQFYPVGKSLERVQGSTRMTIERYRSLARAQAYERQQRRDAVRYEQRRRAEAEVLRKPGIAPPAMPPVVPPAPKAPGAAPAGSDAAADDLFSEEADKKPADATPAEEATEPEAAEDKPPAAEAPDAMPADDAPADKDAKSDENPFGDDKEEK
jgi:hypothetical protein